MRRLVPWMVLVSLLLASVPAGATYGTVFVRDWRNMAACQCLTDVMWIAPGMDARLSPDGDLMAYGIVDFYLDGLYGTTEYTGSTALFVGLVDVLLLGKESWRIDRPGVVYWAFPAAHFRWSRDGRYLFYTVLENPRSPRPWYQTWRFDLSTGTSERMPWSHELIMDTTPDGRWGIFVRTAPNAREEALGAYTYRERDVLARDLHTGREIILASRVMIRTGLMSVGITFDETGRRLALPLGDKVHIYDFDGYDFTLSDTLKIGRPVSAAVWDPNGDYLILQEDSAYLQRSRFFPPDPKGVLLWFDLRTGESGPLWPSNFTQEAPWFIPGTRTLAFSTQLGDTLKEIPPEFLAIGERLPPWGEVRDRRCFCPDDDT